MASTERRFPHYGNGEPMYWRKWAIVLMSMPIGIVVQCLLCSVLCSAILGSVSVFFPDPKTSAVNQVKCILSSIESTPIGPLPRGCASAVQEPWTAKCLTFFRDALRENSGKYEVRVTYYNGDDPNDDGRFGDMVKVGVFFPNGQEGEFQVEKGLIWSCGKTNRQY